MQAAGLAGDAAHECDQAATLAVASWGTSVALLTGGMIDLAQAELDSITLCGLLDRLRTGARPVAGPAG